MEQQSCFNMQVFAAVNAVVGDLQMQEGITRSLVGSGGDLLSAFQADLRGRGLTLTVTDGEGNELSPEEISALRFE